MGGKRRINALRLLSDTVNGCYENAFMSVQPSSAVLNIDVAHSEQRQAQCTSSTILTTHTLVLFL